MKPEGPLSAGGRRIGVPPIRGCAQYTAKKSTQYTAKKSTAIVGFRSKEKAILLDHLEEECAKVMVATDDGSLGYHGFVDALVRQELSEDKNYDAVLACGPKPMLRNVAKVAQEFGVPCQVSMEETVERCVAWCAPATWPTAPGSTCARTARCLIPRRWTGMPDKQFPYLPEAENFSGDIIGGSEDRFGPARPEPADRSVRPAAPEEHLPPVDMSVDLAGVKLRNPVVVASGTFGLRPGVQPVLRPGGAGGNLRQGADPPPPGGKSCPPYRRDAHGHPKLCGASEPRGGRVH